MDIQAELQRAKQAAAKQNFALVRDILQPIIDQDPRNVEAWLLSAHVAESPEHATRCLQRVLRLDPTNEIAQRNLMRIQEGAGPTSAEEAVASKPAPISQAKPRTRPVEEEDKGWSSAEKMLVGAGLFLFVSFACLGAIILLVVPELNARTQQAIDAAGDPIETVRENIRAANAEDIDRYMETIHSDSPLFRSTRQALDEAFGTYDLSYRLSNIEVIEQDGEEARLSFTIVTIKVLGPAFADNRVTGEMVMRIEDGVWKIYDQETTDVVYLDE